ncbi:MAG: hypothetical protein KAT29_12375, partial [Anaerolineales bacterium]|nr:hypothetical protein [Anaerolineales bacterium]
IRTRGDNGSEDDPWLLQDTDIHGRVVTSWRGQNRRINHGGRLSLFKARSIYWVRSLDRSVTRLVRPIYHSLARFDFIRSHIPSRFKPRVIAFHTKERVHLLIMLGNREVGRYHARRKQWEIQRPFQLFVDEFALQEIQYQFFPGDDQTVAISAADKCKK